MHSSYCVRTCTSTQRSPCINISFVSRYVHSCMYIDSSLIKFAQLHVSVRVLLFASPRYMWFLFHEHWRKEYPRMHMVCSFPPPPLLSFLPPSLPPSLPPLPSLPPSSPYSCRLSPSLHPSFPPSLHPSFPPSLLPSLSLHLIF